MKGQIKTAEDIALLREGGKRLARVLRALEKEVRPGVTTKSLDDLAYKLITEGGDEPAFLNYTPQGAPRPYPATLCVSINDEIVHGIPNEEEKILQEGDIVSLDIGLAHQGRFVDMASTLPVGAVDAKALELLEVTKAALMAGIQAAKGSGYINDIGKAVEKVVQKGGFTVLSELGGHGVGYAVHEPPYVANFALKGKGLKLLPGMVLALEPIVTEGEDELYLDRDGHTYKTVDGARTAQFEHTILITEGKPEILTV
jgi:methionyl aminopeptidase